MHHQNYLIWHYVKMLRKSEYYYNTGHKFLYALYRRQKNIEGARLGIYINHNCVDKGLLIYHYGSIIIHDKATIGKDCHLHGENCIGNKGTGSDGNAPSLGDNCNLGIGAKVIGNISLGNHVTIGANAVVTKSFPGDNLLLTGIPAVVHDKSSSVFL